MKSTHSWHLVCHYHRCPKCGYIIESRTDYKRQPGSSTKELECDRCGHQFTVTKFRRPQFGPIFSASEEQANDGFE